jgi:polar amino acid transport system substrate-binding protein
VPRRNDTGNRNCAAAVGLALVAWLCAADALAAATATTAGVTIPNFWDPKRRVERPAAGAVTAIRFITTDDFPPFNFLDAGGRLTGFNVDLARAICVELTVPCTIQARPWDDLVATLKNKTADAAIAGIAIGEATRRDLDFSDPYLRPPARFVERRAAATFDPTDGGLKGRPVAVVAGTAHEAYLATFFPDVDRKPYPTADAARQALKAGEVVAAFGDGIQLSIWLESEAAGDCCVFVGGPYLEARFFGEGMAIAVLNGSTDLKRALNTALESIHDKGVYDELYLRYFPISFY